MSGGSGGRRKKKHSEEHEEHENHERWLVSYADLMTVLMALFIVMFAMSTVDRVKFAALAGGLAESFGNPVVAVSGGPKGPETDAKAPDPFSLASKAFSQRDPRVTAAIDEKDRIESESRRKAAEAEAKRLDDAKRKIEAALKKKNLQKSVQFRYNERGLVVTIVTDSVVFAADSATLQPGGRRVVDAVAPALRQLPNNLSVEGHTNLVKSHPKNFPTEWELSTARAVGVVRYLIDHDHVGAKRLTASGYADQRPLVPGTSARANQVNKRVEIVVLSALPPDERALLPAVAGEKPTPAP